MYIFRKIIHCSRQPQKQKATAETLFGSRLYHIICSITLSLPKHHLFFGSKVHAVAFLHVESLDESSDVWQSGVYA